MTSSVSALRYILLCIACLSPLLTFCQTREIKGIIHPFNNRPPNLNLVGIQIYSDGDVAYTEDHGVFTLKTTKYSVGEVISLVVTKPGYVVIDQREIVREVRWFVPKIPKDDASIVRIYVTTQKEFDLSETEFKHGIENEIHVRNEQIAFLKAQIRTMDVVPDSLYQLVAELSRNNLNLQAQVSDLARKLALLNENDATDSGRRAIDLFKAGKINQALEVLDEIKLNKDWDDAEVQENSAKVKKKNIIESMLLRAQILVINFRFQDARRAYENVITRDSTNVYALMEYAKVLRDLDQIDLAIEYYTKAALLSRNSTITAAVLNNVALLNSTQWNLEKADSLCVLCLELLSSLDTANAATRRELQVNCLMTLATIRGQMDLPASADSLYEVARGYYPDGSEVSKRGAENFAALFENRAVLMSGLGRYDIADSLLRQSLLVHRGLLRNDSAEVEDMARVLNNIGISLRARNRFVEADSVQRIAWGLAKHLMAKDSLVFGGLYLDIVRQRAVVMYRLNLLDSADSFLREELILARRLYSYSPGRYARAFAYCLHRNGEYAIDRRNYTLAYGFYQEGLRLLDSLSLSDPGLMRVDYHSHRIDLGLCLMRMDSLKESREIIAQAIHYFRERNAIRGSIESRDNLYHALSAAAQVWSKGLQPTEAMVFGTEALAIAEDLARQDSLRFELQLADQLDDLSYLLQLQGNKDAVSRYTHRAFEIRIAWHQAHRQQYAIELYGTAVRLFDLFQDRLMTTRSMIYVDSLENVIRRYCKARTGLETEFGTESFDQAMYNRWSFVQSLSSDKIARYISIEKQKEHVRSALDVAQKLEFQKKVVKESDRMLVAYGDDRNVQLLRADCYGSLSWFYLLSAKPKRALEAALVATDSRWNREWVKGNLVLAYVLLDRWDEAGVLYRALINTPYPNGSQTWRGVFLKDISELQTAGIGSDALMRARALIGQL